MFDQSTNARRKIAIVGAGISGLSAAYALSEQHDVTIFEAENRLGGHARTVLAGRNGDQPVDTGFIVFNYATYPHLTRLFGELDVPVMKSEMSFGASIDNGWLEYGLNSLGAIAAQKRNLLKPKFYGMIADILRFGKRAEAAAVDDTKTIGELVEELQLGRWFRDYYLMPMCGAIWSTPIAEVDQFPARSLVQFFKNHALLAGNKQHQWYTVQGGSREYVHRLQAALVTRGCTIRMKAPIEHIQRGLHPQRGVPGVTVKAAGAEPEQFDEIILACHSDQSLRILGADATPAERKALSAIRYQPNRAVLHRDPALMPKNRKCWSSWAYRSQNGAIGVTYWMNRLQNIDDNDPLFVTLNPTQEIAQEAIYDDVSFAHPVFDKAALIAQREIRELQGHNRTWFAGAYNRHGFHEDGIDSAMHVVAQMTAQHASMQNAGAGHLNDAKGAAQAVLMRDSA
ncbi:NAD(P)/FAD-dependent oxidoreductase [Shimia sp. MMG029]|uniref:NAD(P)/FAD-dependent oxidoreductase n=1 Tax=Shimia sp. MMG029 TaxID=3021978 RepID=UPI0022FE8BD4|nr:FAD-dependent oxidoreductase [Shimia sp. MMG029]MDA5558293.1 FAD-dependent oxidoreductase [Shimia sp. MMG029]